MDNGKQELTALEREREEIIARNRLRLQEAGVYETARQLAEDSITTRKKSKSKKHVTKEEPNESFRRQTRSQTGSNNSGRTRSQDVETQLGEFIVTGVCPKCEKVYSRNHKRHFINCQGVVLNQSSVIPATRRTSAISEEIEQLRIQEVSISGLITITDQEAKFAVTGSTGYVYTVTLSDTRQTCQCMDHRMRRRACKHIKALLNKLEIKDEPKRWRQATTAIYLQ